MRTTHLSAVDLNLMPALVWLLEEQHVTRAADRVGLSQPAMSRALQRLREALDDELLTRTAAGYVLTPRAERIRDQLGAIVPGLEALFGGERFVPSEASIVLHLAGTDYAAGALGAPLLQRVLAESPKSTVCFHSWNPRTFEEIRSGDLDLAFFGGPAPAGLESSELFTEKFVCVVASGHPLGAQNSVTLNEYLNHDHLLIDIDGGGQPAIENALSALGVRRTARAVLPYHLAAVSALAGTQLIATLPERILGPIANDVRVLSAPPEIDTMHYSACWYPMAAADAAHAWLRGIVTAVGAQLAESAS